MKKNNIFGIFKDFIICKFYKQKFVRLLFLTTYFFNISLFHVETLKSQDTEYSVGSSYIKNIPKHDFYILGPGDYINLSVSSEAKELNSNVVISPEGTVNVKRLNSIYIEGLTINELKKILNKEYKSFVKSPDVKITILNYRSIKVYIDGEVENPGEYILDTKNNLNGIDEINKFPNKKDLMDLSFMNDSFVETQLIDQSLENEINTKFYLPVLTDLVRKAGGITSFADLENIEIIRKNRLSDGGGEIKTNVNLLDALSLKDPKQNIRLLDGDKITIKKNNNPSLEQISKAIKYNLNPKLIKVYVGGRVLNQGTKILKRNTTLNDSILMSGGTKVLKGKVQFIRYDSEGNLDSRKFNTSIKAKRGSYKNPYLKNGDIVFVGKSIFNITSETLNEIADPISSILNIYGLAKLLNDI